MVTLETPICEFGKKAHNFELPGVDGRTWSLQQCMGKNGLLIMFICNHCPMSKPYWIEFLGIPENLSNLALNL